MRVITGTARGRVLKTLEGEDVRPTTDRVKEAIFSIIQFELEGRSVDIVKKNLISTKLENNAEVIRTEAVTFLKGNRKKYDIVFMDPPYSKGLLQNTLPYVVKNVNDGGVIICEHPYGEEMPQTVGNFSIYRNYKYGKIGITVYRISEEDDR